MAGYLNQVQLIGNVGADPELKTLQGGSVVANFTLATTESWKDKNSGEKKERTEWHRIVCWNAGLCEVIEQYVRKGQKLFIQGSLQTRKWEKDGQDHYSTEVVMTGFDAKLLMLDRPKGDRDANDNADRPGNKPREQTYADQKGKTERGFKQSQAPAGRERQRDLDDEIPF